MADYYYLNEGIIINILHRLPVRALLRCTCVCKSWYSLITTPLFISSHFNFQNNAHAPPLLLLRRCLPKSERFALYLDHHQSFTRQTTLDFPFTSLNSYFTIVGSCNGLLCLSDDRLYFVHTIILWNPCVKKSLLLPKPNLIYNSCATFIQCLGFGFDSVANDYKVVRITYVDYGSPQVELYKLSTGVWQDISYLSLHYIIYNKSRQAYAYGATHWVANNYMNSYDLIVLFDMCHEVFREMMLPDILANVDPNTSKDLLVYKESLALIAWNVSAVEPRCCVWVMEEYGVMGSWTKLFDFDHHNFGSGRIMRPLWVRRNGEVVMVREDGRLISYDPNGGEVEDLGVRGSRSEDYRRSVHVESYTTSLVLLERGSCFSDSVTCKELPSLESNDCGSGGSYGSDCEHNSGSSSAK
ncbi:hypothetical protein BUALT_Bualt03G0183900 [Buddleja alternifolia]|uniref:F-box domain-containing protein n=1 Tax=Buddleja alternifolia TaxID=168488 RepID=A0AAV6XVS4_9LAMI|nr:hypothetical protein BUALT_Bualt03G0183900 [Buddleja alternifolia]